MTGALKELCAVQNPDGGWPYHRSSSWTEPTVFALLALASEGELYSPPVANALKWLKANQKPDGGFAPKRLVEESTWVTALVLLLPNDMLAQLDGVRALNWLLSKTGRELDWVQRLRAAMMSGRIQQNGPEGWPWFPDTAAWVAPTAFAILALRKARKHDARTEIRERIQQGQEFLMSRVCQDGGWNHGSTKALGYESASYPETTGLALLALGDLPANRVLRCLDRAEQHLQFCRSAEAASWLRLGLLAHRRPLGTAAVAAKHPASVPELVLSSIVRQAIGGNGIFEA